MTDHSVEFKMNRRLAASVPWVLTLAAMHGTMPAVAAPDPAQALEGPWLVSVDDGHDRFLMVSGVRRDGDRYVASKVSYGYLENKGSVLTQWEARVDGSTVKLAFVTSGQSEVQVEMTLGDEAALGTMLTAKGRNLPLRMTRLALSELAELKDGAAAGKRMDAVRFKADTRIVLIYVGAGDCPSCRRYELEYFHPRNGKMKDVLPEFDAIEYVKGPLASFRTGRIDSVLPSDLAPLARPGPDGAKSALQYHGTPYFALVVDGRVISQVHGATSFERQLLPLVRSCIGRRANAA